MTKGLRIFLDNDANIPGRIALVLLRDHPRVFRWLPLRVPRVFRWLSLVGARVLACRWCAAGCRACEVLTDRQDLRKLGRLGFLPAWRWLARVSGVSLCD